MKLSSKKTRKHKIVWGIVAFFGVIVIGFFVWLIISVITIDTTLSVNEKISIPELGSLNDLPSYDYGDNAVAIDGEVVTSKEFGTDVILPRPTASTAKMILALAVMREKGFSLGETGETITINPEMYSQYVYYRYILLYVFAYRIE